MRRFTFALLSLSVAITLACGGGGSTVDLAEPTCCTIEWANGEVGYAAEPCKDDWTATSGDVCVEVCCRMEDMNGGVNHEAVPAGACQEGMEWGNGYVDDPGKCGV